jgi:hypothetical protein
MSGGPRDRPAVATQSKNLKPVRPSPDLCFHLALYVVAGFRSATRLHRQAPLGAGFAARRRVDGDPLLGDPVEP